MLKFVLGVIVGGAFGVFFMCLLQINRDEDRVEDENFFVPDDFEKSASTGVDNPAKKA